MIQIFFMKLYVARTSINIPTSRTIQTISRGYFVSKKFEKLVLNVKAQNEILIIY